MSKLALATRLGAAAAAALLLAGCTAAGGGAASSASPSADPTVSIVAQPDPNHPDPCELLTAADFEEIGAIPNMSDGRFVGSLSGSNRSICRWEPAAEDLNVPRIQVMLAWDLADLSERRALIDGMGAETVDYEIEGASAAFASQGGRTIGMTVGDYYVQVSYTSPTLTIKTVRPANKALCEIIASRLA
ncbi:DUF3558 family protein [Demequina lignilytica]|uniref:DUF3558 family protein n=1 Tax=Demequina lignilytica TaxID=3051663 RepID=A0AB35MHA1_9MICO|nr:DUF3558 family protein [Demequina sp. SYSU T0a273]MDN4483106.1 DUF3558 family protein [Demequina sp. SYSU T0a273]